MHSFKAPGVARPMQNCNGFAEAVLRHYLIKATEQGSRAATSQLYWLFSGRPPYRCPPPQGRGSRGGRSALKMLPPHPPRQPLDLFDKSGSTLDVGCMWYAPRNAGERTTDVLSGKRDKKAARYSVILIPRPPGVVAPIIFRGLRPVA